MSKQLQNGSVVLRVVLFFARHPEEDLTTNDVAVKFEVRQEDVNKRLRGAVRDGLLAYKSDGPGRGKLSTYSAGPLLLSMVGVTRETVEACMAHMGDNEAVAI